MVRPEAGADVEEAAAWYDARSQDLGDRFTEEVLAVLDALAENPLLNSSRLSAKNIRWRYPERFPYRVIYEVQEAEGLIIVAAVLHASRHDREWRKRV